MKNHICRLRAVPWMLCAGFALAGPASWAVNPLTVDSYTFGSIAQMRTYFPQFTLVEYYDGNFAPRDANNNPLTGEDRNFNSIPDYWEMLIIQDVLATPLRKNHALAQTIWTHNLQQMQLDVGNALDALAIEYKAAFKLGLTFYVTMGDSKSLDFVENLLSTYTAALARFRASRLANLYHADSLPVFGSSVQAGIYADSDGGGISNLDEFLSVRINSPSCGGQRTRTVFLAAVFSVQDDGTCTGTAEADDADSDGLLDTDEATYNTNPNDPDSDDDGLLDGDEVYVHGTNPTLVDSDGDGLDDNDEVSTTNTDPGAADTDGDGLDDGDELNVHNTDPLNIDSDSDSLEDGLEIALGTDPHDPDTDGDGMKDGVEVTFGSDPLSPLDVADLPLGGGLTRLLMVFLFAAGARVVLRRDRTVGVRS